jgi:hypothetical protein
MFGKLKGSPPMAKAPNDAPADRAPSRWQGVIDHLNASHAHLGQAMDILSTITFDLQRGADFIMKYRDSLINAIEANGGRIEQGSVEQQIADFLPKRMRDEQQQESS